MRARQFVIEYDRTKTAQAFTSKLVNQALKDPTTPGAVRNNINSMESPQKAAEMILQNQIEVGDPTKQKKYTQALARMYANGLIKWEDVGSTMRDYLTKFTKLALKKKLNPEHTDFNRFKDLKSFYDAVDTYPDPEEDQEVKDKGEAKEVFNNGEVRIIRPDNEQAACYYGQGTRWCTAARDHNMFDRYNTDGPMYIILPKNPKHDGEKYQFHPMSDQYMDEKDRPVYPQVLLNLFPSEEFKEFLFKADPILKSRISLYPNDQELESAWRSIAERVNDKAFEVMYEWEDSDDYYYQYLKDEGFVDEEGDIKDDAPPYDEYNEEAGAWLYRMMEIRDRTADEIREIAQDLEGLENRDYYLRDLDDIYSYAIEIAQDRDQTAGLEVWVYKNVDVKYYADRDEITVELVKPRNEQ
jgi:hypothetical protein